jgi:hypothetical protein
MRGGGRSVPKADKSGCWGEGVNEILTKFWFFLKRYKDRQKGLGKKIGFRR